MVGPQRFLADGEGALVERLGFDIFCAIVKVVGRFAEKETCGFGIQAEVRYMTRCRSGVREKLFALRPVSKIRDRKDVC